MDVLPPEEWLAAHQAMIYFGRAICHPKIQNVTTIPNYMILVMFKGTLKSFCLILRVLCAIVNGN